LVPFIQANGRNPVFEWLEDVKWQHPEWHEEFRSVWGPRIQKHGPEIMGRSWGALKGGLFKIKWHKCRIYCSLESDRRIVMYVGVIKSWREFLNEHRQLCNRRRKEFLSPEYDQEHRELLYKALCKRRETNGLV
jgi:hypothetical protein